MILFLLIATVSYISLQFLCVPFIGSFRTSRPTRTTRSSWLTRFSGAPGQMGNGDEEEQEAHRVAKETGMSKVCLNTLESWRNLKQIVTVEFS